MIDMDRLYELIGEGVRQLRDSAPGMNQEALAQVLELTRTSVTNIECGRQKLSLDALYRLCDRFNVEPQAVLPPLSAVRTNDATRERVLVGGRPHEVEARTAELIRSLQMNADRLRAAE